MLPQKLEAAVLLRKGSLMSSEKKTNPAIDTAKAKKDVKSIIKNKFGYFMSVILLVLIVISFVVVQALPQGGSSAANASFGSYDGVSIEYKRGNFLFNDIERQRQMYRNTDDPAQLKDIYRTSFDRYVKEIAKLRLVQRMGLTVSQEAVIKAIRDSGSFNDPKTGTYDPQLFEAYKNSDLNAIGLLYENIQESLLIEKARSTIAVASTLSESEKKFFEQMFAWERSFELVGFSENDYPLSQLLDHYNKNKSLYQYRDFSVINFASQEDLQAARSQIVGGTKTFEDLADNGLFDNPRLKDSKRPRVLYYDLRLDIAEASKLDALYQLPNGSLSEDINVSGNRWRLYRADTDTVSLNVNNETDLADVRRYLLGNERGLVQDYVSQEAQDFVKIAQASSLSSAAKRFKKDVKNTVSFPINYRGLTILYPQYNYEAPAFAQPSDSENKAIENALNNEEFWITAFSLKTGQVSAPLSLGGQTIILKILDEKRPLVTTVEALDASSRNVSMLEQIVQSTLQKDFDELVVDENLLKDNFSSAFDRSLQQ